MSRKKLYDVTLIDSKNFFEYTPGVLRIFVDLAHLARVTAKLPARSNSLVVGTVVDVLNGQVVVKKGSGTKAETVNVPYDYLCIATGSTYPGKIKPTYEATLEERTTTWSGEYERLLAADTVLIIGAGAVGVELAGEVDPSLRILKGKDSREIRDFDCSYWPRRSQERIHARRSPWLTDMLQSLLMGFRSKLASIVRNGSDVTK